jgi:hypothetical protein
LDTGGYHCDISTKSSHLGDVGEVLDDHVCAGELLLMKVSGFDFSDL